MNERASAVKTLCEAQFQSVCNVVPQIRANGLTLFLGRSYGAGDPPVLMLGLNPGGPSTGRVDTDLAGENYLLGDPAHDHVKRFRYWRNARRCFGATAALEQAMQEATFSFCCPFRTRSWTGLPTDVRRTLTEHSAPILGRILTDCQPRFVLTAGVTARRLFGRLASLPLEAVDGTRDGHGRIWWARFKPRTESSIKAVLQLPHFSRYSSRLGLASCGCWLTSQMALDSRSVAEG